MTYLLCDIVSFGKINLKNLRKLQKLDLSKADNFSSISGLKPADTVDLKIHDSIAHQAIPQTIKRHLPNNDKIKFTKDAKKVKFLPLVNTNNQVQRGLNNSKKRLESNRYIEDLVQAVEGKASIKQIKRGDSSYTIGKALRKKKLSEVEKLATNTTRYELTKDLIESQRPPTQEDVKKFISEVKVRNGNWKGSRFEPKQRGAKPKERSISSKISRLEDRYGLYE